VTAVLERVRAGCVLAVLVVLPLVYWPWARDAYHIVKFAALAVFAVPAFMAWWALGRPGLKAVPRWYLGAAGGFLAWALLRGAGAEDRTAALLRAMEWMLTFAAGAAALGLARRERDAALDALTGAGALTAAVGIVQYLFGRQIFSRYAVEERSVTFTTERVFSTFGNPIFFAGFLILTLPPVVAELAACLGDGQLRRSAVYGGAAVLELVALSLTASRGAVLGLAAGLGFLVFALPRARGRIIGLAAAAVALVTAVGIARPELIRHLLTGGDPGRLLMWRTAFAMWGKAPALGVGLGQFALRYPCVQMGLASPGEVGFGVNAVHAHNDYLEAAAELGLPGLVLFLLAFPGLLFLPAASSRGWGIKGGVLAVAVHGLFNFPLSTAPVQPFVWLLPAVWLGATVREPGPAVTASRAFASAAVSVAAGGLLLIPLVRSSYHQWALAYQDAHQYPRAAGLLDRAELLMADDVGSRLGFHRGKLDFEAGDLKDAEFRFRADMARFPCYPEGYGNLGVVYGVRAMQGERSALSVAQDWIGQALRLRPGGREAATDYNSLGNIRVLAGNERGALESYRQALACDDAFVGPAVNAARLLMKRHRNAEAAAIIRGVLAHRPSDPELQQLALALGVAPPPPAPGAP